MLTVGRMKMRTSAIEALPDWPKVHKLEWRRMNEAFVPLAVFDCGEELRATKLPDTVKLSARLTNSALSPLGRPLPKVANDRMERIKRWSGAKDTTAVTKLILNQFEDVTVKVPKADFERVRNKDYRMIAGYWRRDRHVLLLPEKNPYDDYLILCLPYALVWGGFVVGICGREESQKYMDGFQQLGGVFPGPYRSFPPKSLAVRKFYARITKLGQPLREVPLHKEPWKHIYKEIDAQKRQIMAKIKGKAAYTPLGDPREMLTIELHQRIDSILIAEKYGKP